MNFKEDDLKEYINKCIKKRIDGNIVAITYYSSFMEDLGNKKSDVDVYVIYDGDVVSGNLMKRKNCYVEFDRNFYLDLDIEYYSLKKFLEIKKYSDDFKFNRNSSIFKFDIDKIKFLHKYSVSKIFYQNSEYSKIVNGNTLNKEVINKIICNNYYNLYRGEIDDALKFYSFNDIYSSFIMSQKSFLYLLMACFAYKNKPIVKGKWVVKRLQESNFVRERKIFENYYFIPFNKITKESVESFIEQIQEIAMEIQYND